MIRLCSRSVEDSSSLKICTRSRDSLNQFPTEYISNHLFLTGDNPDSLLVLENRFQNASKVILDQTAEISDLTKQCRILQTKLDKSLVVQEKLLLQQRELQEESVELKEFMQAEKDALFETLKESENEVKLYKSVVRQKDKELENKEERCSALIRISEQIR